MNLKNILWVRNTGKILPSASIQENLFGLKLSGGGGSYEKTIDFTPVISVSDAKAGAVIDYQFKITAVQSGTGDPTPSNIRPITGWTGANIHVNDSVISVSWQSEAGTVYGGILDATTGTLTVNAEYITLNGTEDWASVSSGTSKYFRLNFAETGYRSGNEICDQYTLTSIARDNTDVGFSLILSSGYYQFRFRPENITSVNTEGWKTMLANQPVHVVIYKSKPITYTITPTEIALLEGANTLWADTGDSAMTYLARAAENVRKMNLKLAQNTAILKSGGKIIAPIIEKPIVKKGD